MFARGDYFANLNSSPDVYNSPVSPVNTPNLIPGWAWAVGHTWSIKPSMVFVQHFSMADSQTNRVPLTLGFDQKSLGFPSTVTEGQLAAFFPTVTVAGTSGVGAVGTVFNVVISRTYQYQGALTILKGAHTIKAGVDYRHYTLDWSNPTPLTINANGTYTGGPNARAVSANTGSGIADLVLGVAAVSYNINPQHVNSHPYYAGFVQDEWRVTRDLTLTMGLRYNLELGSVERNDHYVFLDTTSPVSAQRAGVQLAGRPGVQRSERKFAAGGGGRSRQLESAGRAGVSDREPDGGAGRVRDVSQSAAVDRPGHDAGIQPRDVQHRGAARRGDADVQPLQSVPAGTGAADGQLARGWRRTWGSRLRRPCTGGTRPTRSSGRRTCSGSFRGRSSRTSGTRGRTASRCRPRWR